MRMNTFLQLINTKEKFFDYSECVAVRLRCNSYWTTMKRDFLYCITKLGSKPRYLLNEKKSTTFFHAIKEKENNFSLITFIGIAKEEKYNHATTECTYSSGIILKEKISCQKSINKARFFPFILFLANLFIRFSTRLANFFYLNKFA